MIFQRHDSYLIFPGKTIENAYVIILKGTELIRYILKFGMDLSRTNDFLRIICSFSRKVHYERALSR